MTIKLLIDTDPGMGTKDSDPEDSFAITFALNSPEIDVVGITCVSGNVPVANGYANTLHLMGLLGRPDVPVAYGAALPLEPGRRPAQLAWLDYHSKREVFVDPSDVPASRLDAVELIVRSAREANGELVIAPIGPLTNIALALRAHPELRDQIKELRVMGGSFGMIGNLPVAEFNIWLDPEAADEVVRSGIPITFVGLDVCVQTHITDRQVNAETVSSDLGRFFAISCESYLAALGDRGHHLFDSLTIASLVEPSLLTTEPRWVAIETSEGPAQGATVASREEWRNLPWHTTSGAAPGRVAVDLDVERFDALFAERVLSLL